MNSTQTHRYEPFFLQSIRQMETVLAIPRDELTYEEWWASTHPEEMVLPPNLSVVSWAVKFTFSGPSEKKYYAHRQKQAAELLQGAPSWKTFIELLNPFKDLMGWVGKNLEDEREAFWEERQSPPPGN